MRTSLPATIGKVTLSLWVDGVPVCNYTVDTNPATLLEVSLDPDAAIESRNKIVSEMTFMHPPLPPV